MGTRGLFGFHFRGKYYVVYNHWDSYPSGLGYIIVKELQEAIRSGKLEEWIRLLEQLKVVDPQVPPTPEDIQTLRSFTDLGVSTQSTSDWYCLLRGCQGSLEQVLRSRYLLNATDPDGIPCWEEYAYVINLDTKQLEYYVGSELVESFDFENLPNWRSE